MNKKVTFTISEATLQLLEKSVNKGEKSSFVAEAIEEKLFRAIFKRKKSKSPLEEFFELRDKLPKISRKELLEARRWGRK